MTMRVRWQWIIGLVGVVIVGRVTGQESSTTSTAEETKSAPPADAPAEANATETSTKPALTGNPQIDYIHDPNLPHELRGYDLSDYPFYARLPEDLLLPSFNFTCDDRHDGFYASVPHKCQVYHNCLFGQRYDFLCANYTVFDQKNFICHYVSEVDCKNSAKHYDRNDELYVTTTTTTTTQAPPQVIFIERPRPLRGGPGAIRPKRPRPFGGNKRRPGNRRTTTTPAPVFYDDEYYYDDYYDQYYDDYYNDYANDKTTTTTTTTTQRPRRPQRTRLGGQGGGRQSERGGNVFSVKDRKRPRINRPVPQNDDISSQGPRSSRLQQASPPNQQIVDDAPAEAQIDGPRRRRPGGPGGPGGRKPRPGPRQKKTTTTTTTTTESAPEDEYYDYYYDYADETTTTTTTTTAAPKRPGRPGSRRPGGPQRRPQNRPSSTTTTEEPTTTTTTEPPVVEEEVRSRVARPGRVNVRKNPLISRNEPAVEIETSEPVPRQDTAESGRPRPARLRPRFPSKRPGSPTQDEEVIGREEPTDVETFPVADATNVESSEPRRTRPSLSRTPIRRLGLGKSGSSRQESPQLGRGQVHQESLQSGRDYAYDYYDDY